MKTDTKEQPAITPEPWTLSRDATPDYAYQATIYSENTGERVATAFQSEAIARLIAAAPDLLEALKQSNTTMDSLRHQIEQMRGMFNDEDGTIAAACSHYDATTASVNAALQKATQP